MCVSNIQTFPDILLLSKQLFWHFWLGISSLFVFSFSLSLFHSRYFSLHCLQLQCGNREFNSMQNPNIHSTHWPCQTKWRKYTRNSWALRLVPNNSNMISFLFDARAFRIAILLWFWFRQCKRKIFRIIALTLDQKYKWTERESSTHIHTICPWTI